MEKNEQDTKFCSKCDQDLPLEKFGKNPRYCKSCVNAYSRKHYTKDPEKKKVKVRDWQKDNPEKVQGYNENWKEAHPEQYSEKCQAWFNSPTMKDLNKLVQSGILKPVPKKGEEG